MASARSPQSAKTPAKKPTSAGAWGCLLIILLLIFFGVYTASTSSTSVPPGVSAATDDATAQPQLELESWTWHEESGFAISEGRVKNISSSPLDNVTAVVSFEDHAGGHITTGDALIDYNPVLPGQTSPFKVMATWNPAMRRASIDFKELMGGTIAWRERAKKK